MPLFDFVCKSCGADFEALVIGGNKPACPKCKSEELEKKMSTFAVRTSNGAGGYSSGAGAKCAGCAGTSCDSCR